MNNPVDVIRAQIESLLSKSSENELNKRKLGRSKKGIALDELRAGLSNIVEYLNEVTGEVRDHTLDKDIVSRLADKSWRSDGLKKQQASLKRTGTELGKAKTIIDNLISVVSDQYAEKQFSYSDVQNGRISEEDYYAQKSPIPALRAKRGELENAQDIVGELRAAIEWAKDIKKRDEAIEKARQSAILSKLRAEISKQVCSLSTLDIIVRMSALEAMWFEPKDALTNLEEYGSKSHLEYLTNNRNRFISELLEAIEYKFTCQPNRPGMRKPLSVDSENIALQIDREYQDFENIKNSADYTEYVELYKSAKAVQSIFQSESK